MLGSIAALLLLLAAPATAFAQAPPTDAADTDAVSFGYLPHYVLGGYLVVLVVIGIIGLIRSKQSEEDYYLAGRGQGWLVSSLTIMATFFSSFALLGAPGMVYKDGVVFALFALNVPLGGAVVYVFGSRICKVGRARGFVTPADMICDYYGSPVALRVLTAFIGFVYAVVYVVIQLQAGGILAQRMFPNAMGGEAFSIGVVALSIITMLYIMVGGMRSVAWSDVIQGSLLIGGMLLAGAAAVSALGGVGPFFERINELPAEALTFPGVTDYWTPWVLFTVCLVGSIGSMIQPAQWMRYYSASSTKTLRRSAMIFAIVLTGCFLFGVMLVGMGGQVLYPVKDAEGYRVLVTQETPDGQTTTRIEHVPHEQLDRGTLLPHPVVGEASGDFDQVLVVVLKRHAPQLLGAIGPFVVCLVLVAILAASMSTADSNLHALSAVLTRDVYDRFIRPGASQRERTWVGRLTIMGATGVALLLIWMMNEHGNDYPVFAAIAKMGLLAIAFSSQLIPLTIDILLVRKGTRAGAIAGMAVGIGIVALFTPFFQMFTEQVGGRATTLQAQINTLRGMIDIGAWGVIGNVAVFVVVSAVTKRVDRERVGEYAGLMR